MNFVVTPPQPNYYNTFVQPMQPRQLQGSGPSFGSYSDQLQPQWMDQGSGKFGYGSQQDPYSQQRNVQNRQQLDAASLQALNQGLTGQAAIDFINKQLGYNTGAVWDAQRGNIDVGTGGPNGIQYDRSAGGGYGAHPYNDAGVPQMQGGMQSTMPGGGFNPNDPMAWRRQHMMRQMQRPMYGGGYQGGYGPNTTYNPNVNQYSGQPGFTTGIMGAGLQGSAPTSYQALNSPFGQSRPNMVANSNGQVNQAYNRLNY